VDNSQPPEVQRARGNSSIETEQVLTSQVKRVILINEENLQSHHASPRSRKFRRLAAIADAENRAPTNYVETLVLHDLDAKNEANRVITIYEAPESAYLVPGEIERSEGETEERFAQRKRLVDELMSIPDEG
jgi:hypothetical protein